MENKPSTARQAWLVVMALCGWFALLSQFTLNINSGIAPLPEIIIRYFSYFTILTNILVAAYCTILLLNPGSRLGRIFSRLTVVTAITFYIVIVGVTYNLILRSLWDPQGLQKIVDELLHTIVPALFLLYWLIFIPRTGLRWSSVLPWMVFPLLYIILALIRGSFSGFYPYPFVDVGLYGLGQVLLNSLLFTMAFFILGFLFVGVAKLLAAKNINR
jgi:hypothetical protein